MFWEMSLERLSANQELKRSTKCQRNCFSFINKKKNNFLVLLGTFVFLFKRSAAVPIQRTNMSLEISTFEVNSIDK